MAVQLGPENTILSAINFQPMQWEGVQTVDSLDNFWQQIAEQANDLLRSYYQQQGLIVESMVHEDFWVKVDPQDWSSKVLSHGNYITDYKGERRYRQVTKASLDNRVTCGPLRAVDNEHASVECLMYVNASTKATAGKGKHVRNVASLNEVRCKLEVTIDVISRTSSGVSLKVYQRFRTWPTNRRPSQLRQHLGQTQPQPIVQPSLLIEHLSVAAD